MRALIVEDEPQLAGLLVRGLSDAGIDAQSAGSGEAALDELAVSRFDVICLDLGLPGMDGLEVCRRLREDGDATPILMLTARDSVADRIGGLDSGADDYLVKPFDFGEFLARVRALARRPPSTQVEELVVGDLVFDLTRHHVRRGRRSIELSAKEALILELFMRSPGIVLSRLQILEGAWDTAYEHRSNVVDVYIRYLREKIDRPFGVETLQTVRGVGYRLVEAERTAKPAAR